MKATYQTVKHELSNAHEYHHYIDGKLYAHSSYKGCVMFNFNGKPIAKLNYIPK